MIPIDDLLFSFDTKINKLSNLEHQYIPDETKIDILNKSQDKLFIKKIGLNNNYQLGLDAFKKRYEDLQFFVVPYSKLEVTKNKDDILNSYSSNITTLPSKLFIPIDAYVVTSRGECKNRRLKIIELVKHGDLQLKLDSPQYTPSFEYQETLGTMSENIFYTYSDKTNSFEINNLYITYLRYPKKMDIAGYIHLDNSPSVLQDCELDPYLESELMDIVQEEVNMIIGNQEGVQNAIRRTKEND